MPNSRDYYAISVESRKGGVGKTTAALHAARILKDKDIFNFGHNIIFFDLDIAGTEASTIGDTPMWKDNMHVVKNPFDTKKDFNLVRMFERYMSGQQVPAAENVEKKTGVIGIRPGRINVFSSRLDRGNSPGGDANNKWGAYGPEALFDEMHANFFIEMLKDIIKSCVDVFKVMPESENKKTIVIIDNAPGYSGLEPAVERWLTDLGPECGKFLFVCSLDAQDFAGCVRSITEVHKSYCNKWDASRDYLKMHEEEESVVDINKHDKDFFHRLAESTVIQRNRCTYPGTSHSTCKDCGLCFYRQRDKDDSGKPHFGENHKKAANHYICILPNKVPVEIYDGLIDFSVDDVITDLEISGAGKGIILSDMGKQLAEKRINGAPGIGTIFEGIYENEKSNRMIPFQAEWMTNFMVQNLIGKIVTEKDGKTSDKAMSGKRIGAKTINHLKNLQKMKVVFSTSEKQFRAADLYSSSTYEQAAIKGLEISLMFDGLLWKVFSPEEIFENAYTQKLYEDDYLFGVSQIPLVVGLSNIIEPNINLGDDINSAIRQSIDIARAMARARAIDVDIAIAVSRAMDIDLNIDFEIAREIARNVDTKIDIDSVNPIDMTIDREIVKDITIVISSAISRAIAISKAIASARIKYREISGARARARAIVTDIVKLIFIMTKLNHENDERYFSGRILNAEFWVTSAKEIESTSSLARKTLIDAKEKGWLNKELLNTITTEMLANVFIHFCSVQARFVDLKDDLHFLIDCAKALLVQNQPSATYIGGMKDIIRKVVIEKTLSHDDGLKYLKQAGLPNRYDMYPQKPASGREIVKSGIRADQIAVFNKKLGPVFDKLWNL